MITYVNNVFVGKGAGVATAMPTADTTNTTNKDANKFVVVNNNGVVLTSSTAPAAEAIKIGMITGKNAAIVNHKTGAVTYTPIIKWSNVIKKADIKSYHKLTYAADTEDAVTIDLSGIAVANVQSVRLVVRLTFKDLPTRFRKWTESYEIITSASDTKATIATAIANKINSEYKRARVAAVATTTSGSEKVVITALPYDDDDTVDSISPANKVRFSCNMWKTDPNAEGFLSKNKYSIAGLKITKNAGKTYAASWKLVRDLEAQAMGYGGILNRGEGTWPIIKPGMNVVENGHYNGITLEFENMYRTADDLQRHTKEAVNIFDTTTTDLAAILDAFVKGADVNNGANATIETGTSDAE